MKRSAFLVFLGIAAMMAACSTNDFEGDPKKNQPPTVWLSAAPPEGSTGRYRVQLFWGGWDPDGEIAGYEYLVSNNETGTFNPADTVGVPWQPVYGNDSTFTFTADQEVDTLNTSKQVAEFTRSHTFFIRAFDSEGMRSLRPAHRSFTSRTLSPRVAIDVPVRNAQNPADLPAIFTVRWRAFDSVDDPALEQEPDSVQWALVNTSSPAVPGGGLNKYKEALNYLRSPAANKEWYPWVWYRAPQDSGKFWTTPPVDLGTYVFAIRAKDEAGAITPVLDPETNVRDIRVTERNTGPIMTVSNDYLGVVRTAVCAPRLTLMDVPAGVAMRFKVCADASSYGGSEAGYRYGWDISNLEDPDQWEIDLTPFLPNTKCVNLPPRTYFFGTHTLTMEVVDNSGYCSRVQVKVNIVQFTLERSLLIVDDDFTDDLSSGWATSGYATDAEHDAFWLQMVSEVSGFDPELDFVDTKRQYLPLTQLAQYKSILWYTYGDVGTARPTNLIYAFIKHRPKNPPPNAPAEKINPNVLALAMAAGGHIMIAGRHPVQHVVNRTYYGNSGLRYPVIWLWDLEGAQSESSAPGPTTEPIGDLSFAYRELCLETMEFAEQNTRRWRQATGSNRNYCPTSNVRGVGGITTSPREDTMREALPIDPNFPTLVIRPEAGGPDRLFGLDVEVYNPFFYQRNSGLPGACSHVPPPRPCFQPMFGLGCRDTLEPVYNQPIGFWTSAYADRVADVQGAVGARSVVLGFSPVFFTPGDFQPVMDHILFNEWKLPRGGNASATMGAAGSGASPE